MIQILLVIMILQSTKVVTQAMARGLQVVPAQVPTMTKALQELALNPGCYLPNTLRIIRKHRMDQNTMCIAGCYMLLTKEMLRLSTALSEVQGDRKSTRLNSSH